MRYVGFGSSGGAVMLPPSSGADVELRWSDAGTWEQGSPGPLDAVRVAAGTRLVVDQDIHVGALEIAGSVRLAPRDISIRAGGILVHSGGLLRAGETQAPFRHRLTITLEGRRGHDLGDGLGGKFLAALDGGRIELIGQRRHGWVMLDATTLPGSSQIRVAEPVDWQPGEQIAIASGGPDLPLVEEHTVLAVGSDRCRVSLREPARHRHLGQTSPVHGALPGSIGRVVLLSRSLVVEGDERSRRDGFGAHCLIARHAPTEQTVDSGARVAVGRFQGVEFRRMGQFNVLGRYPLHWHDDGDAGDSMLVDSVVRDSFQRGVVIIGTRGVKLRGNAVYQPCGHGFILDASDAGGSDGAPVARSNLAVRPRTVRFAHAAMRILAEHRPCGVWMPGHGRPRTLPPGTVLR